MKRHLLRAAALATLFALTACDQVRVPGINPAGQDEQQLAEAEEILAQAEAETEDTGDTIAMDPLPAEETTEEPATDPVDRDAPAGETPDEDSAQAEQDPSLTPESILLPDAPSDSEEAEGAEAGAEGEDTASAEPLPSLASLNAVSCHPFDDAPVTPTVATVAGATRLEEPSVGAAAVNGLAASLAAFPGIVKIEPRATLPSGITLSSHCSATRIADNWFITAAHCVDDSFEEIRLIGESENLRSPLARTTSATVAICHGGYHGTENAYANDLALIRLTDEQVAAFGNVPIARFGATEKPLAPANYDLADMAGWGITHFGGQLSNDLLSASLSLTGSGPAIIYVASRGGAGPCVGDSGGPLYVTEEDGTRTLVGVLSVVEQNPDTGEFCAGDYNGRYTNLQGYSDWITGVMARCDADPETCR